MDSAMKFFAGVLLVVTCLTSAYAETSPLKNYSQVTLFKNWALSRCISKVSSQDELRNDANASASAYLEFGHAAAASYEAADKLVDEYLARDYSGSVPGKFNTMKCIDLLHSKELEELARKEVRKAKKK